MATEEKPAKAPAVVTVDEQLAELAAKLEAFEAGLPELIGKHVTDVAGPIVAKVVEEVLTPYVAELEKITAKGETAAEGVVGEGYDELKRLIDHVHARVLALHNGLQRAIGILVPLPELQDTPDTPVGEITVAGAETAANQP